ncbi:hypothetical protein ACF3MZ_28090 [Paenibacillaceae bacterium WGS1546]|uniref:hypothetical protein n=1 Tax=Cohnella sp. WGS1546 TaxID=3366810 RepID=UPI00372D2867
MADTAASSGIGKVTSIRLRYTIVPMLPIAATPMAIPNSPLVSDKADAAPAFSGGDASITSLPHRPRPFGQEIRYL